MVTDLRLANLVVAGLLKPVLDKLGSIPVNLFATAWGVEAELRRMQSTLSAIQAVLQDAEQKQWTNDGVKDWLGKLKAVAYDADDVIDEFAAEAAIWKIRGKRGALHKAGKYFLLPKRLYFRLKIGEKFKKLNRTLADIDRERQQFHLIDNPVLGELAAPSRMMTNSAEVMSKPYGQDAQKETVMDALLNNLKGKHGVLVYVIYGMGGIGKTTLAKTIFNDPRVAVSGFKFKLWVCVSENFDIPRLIRAMLELIDDGNAYPELKEEEPLYQKLKEKLNRQEFLLILDDVWNEDRVKWDQLKEILSSCGGKGSVILVTTRAKKVALMMTNLPHNTTINLTGLSKDDSWSLFKQNAIVGRTEEDYMRRIGEELLKRCCGVPLAIKALGSVMSSKLGEDQWRSVKEIGIWSLEDEGKAVMSTLGVSFYHLLPQLRQCFLYCCVFPKDHLLVKDELIRLWMANGFIPSESWYVIGQWNFDELVSKSFIQDVEEKDDIFRKRATTVCKIHDLMHDLGLSIMGDECFNNAQSKSGTPISSNKVVRHLYSPYGIPSEEQMSTTKFQSVVSFLGKNEWRPYPHFLFGNNECQDPNFVFGMKYLRVLSVRFNKKWPLERMSRLTHLRYLDLSNSDIEVLPESIFRLQNLQILNLEGCDKLHRLPKGLEYLKNLSYLNISGCSNLKNMLNMEYLAGQQMQIDGLVVKLGICSLKQIEVCGALKLELLHRVKNPQDADLKSKAQLQNLVLKWVESDGASDVMAECVGVMEALQPPPNLRRLSIYRYPGLVFPTSWWVDSLHLQKLTRIFLGKWGRCENLSPLEKLPLLAKLDLYKMPSLKFLVYSDFKNNNSNNKNLENVSLFPALRTLYLDGMRGLEGWMATSENKEETANINSNSSNERGGGGVEMFKNLEELEVTDCDNLMMAAPPSPSSSIGAMKMTSLKILHVDNYKHLVSFCQLGVRDLDSLIIKRCLEDDTPPLPLQHPTSVRGLVIRGCERLTTLPVSFLGAFNSITHLYIMDCRNLTTLPDGLLNNDNLKHSLEKLSIIACPKLDKAKCREGGEYWPLISHIPQLHID